MTIEELHEYCIKNNITLPENKLNKRYVIRAIERKSISEKSNKELRGDCIVVGISTKKEQLRTRIEARTEQLFEDGVVEEATMLGKKYAGRTEAMTGNIYPLVKSYLDGDITMDEAKEKNTTADWRLAKRQLTWLRRNSYIKWYSLTEARTYLLNLLAKA